MSELSEEDDLIPVRMIESVVYCPRQAWYRFVAGDDPTNLHMVHGLLRHDTLDGGEPHAEGEVIYRHLSVRAPALGVAGVLDEVSIGDQLIITEYKASHLVRLVWPGIVAQLAVQYLALREHAARPDWHGPILPHAATLRVYFTDSRRYRVVEWGSGVEQAARVAVTEARRILGAAVPPEGFVGPRCEHCQHEPICLPRARPILLAATR
jgi:CRISPR/Cas system-associated exonuclease Cas4 (RecB family)